MVRRHDAVPRGALRCVGRAAARGVARAGRALLPARGRAERARGRERLSRADGMHPGAPVARGALFIGARSEEHTSELQSLTNLVCRLLLEKKKDDEEPPTYGDC